MLRLRVADCAQDTRQAFEDMAEADRARYNREKEAWEARLRQSTDQAMPLLANFAHSSPREAGAGAAEAARAAAAANSGAAAARAPEPPVQSVQQRVASAQRSRPGPVDRRTWIYR